VESPPHRVSTYTQLAREAKNRDEAKKSTGSVPFVSPLARAPPYRQKLYGIRVSSILERRASIVARRSCIFH
jgi:hypothetical protein